jgi:hypothetical protein
MATNHRIFISFAIEDRFARDNLVFQANQEHTPFSFVDMSVKKPWDSSWKTNCRTRIKGCDGLIAMLSANTLNAEGALWEIKCAQEERVPILALHVHKDRKADTPSVLSGYPVYEWTWAAVQGFLNRL